MIKNRRTFKSKALLAVMLAGQIVSSQSKVQAQDEHQTKSPDVIITEIAGNSTVGPQHRAYLLLRFALDLFYDADERRIQATYENQRHSFHRYRGFESDVAAFAAGVATSADIEFATGKRRLSSKTDSDTKSSTKVSSASQQALSKAIEQIEQLPKSVLKSELTFVAANLLAKFGRESEANKLRDSLMAEIQNCELSNAVNPQQTESSAALLDCIAFSLVPLRIPDFKPSIDAGPPPKVTATDKQINEAETIKLRALKLLDRLPADNHIRRKAHRDMTLWYLTLNKQGPADEQKELLFKLVGWRGDQMLYPQAGGCGSPVWWEEGPPKIAFDCGMG